MDSLSRFFEAKDRATSPITNSFPPLEGAFDDSNPSRIDLDSFISFPVSLASNIFPELSFAENDPAGDSSATAEDVMIANKIQTI